MKKYLSKFMKNLGTLAISAALISNYTTCSWFIHQPKVPNNVKKLK